ncbi:MAG TPA: hypothetical protein VLH12_08595 [Usitatibacter sp.]|nr:hypothetical protein [Usitatibacter sp.]
MTTKIRKPVRREIIVAGEPHTVVVDKNGVRVSRKLAKRHGATITWGELLAGAAYRGDIR